MSAYALVGLVALVAGTALGASRCAEAREEAVCRHAIQRNFAKSRLEAQAMIDDERRR